MKHWLIDNCGVVNSILFSPETSRICYGFTGTRLNVTADMLLEMEKAAGGGLFFRVISE